MRPQEKTPSIFIDKVASRRSNPASARRPSVASLHAQTARGPRSSPPRSCATRCSSGATSFPQKRTSSLSSPSGRQQAALGRRTRTGSSGRTQRVPDIAPVLEKAPERDESTRCSRTSDPVGPSAYACRGIEGFIRLSRTGTRAQAVPAAIERRTASNLPRMFDGFIVAEGRSADPDARRGLRSRATASSRSWRRYFRNKGTPRLVVPGTCSTRQADSGPTKRSRIDSKRVGTVPFEVEQKAQDAADRSRAIAYQFNAIGTISASITQRVR